MGKGQLSYVRESHVGLLIQRPIKCHHTYTSPPIKPAKNEETGVTSRPNVRSVPRSTILMYSGVAERTYSIPIRSAIDMSGPLGCLTARWNGASQTQFDG